MRHALAGTLIACALLGCAEHGAQLEQERSYVLEWIGERPLIDDSHLTLTLGSDNRAYGNAGCNHWFAPYALDGERITFGAPGKTRKLCAPAIMEQEQRFIEALPKLQRWDVSAEGQVRFWPAEGKPLRFWADES